MVKSSQQDGRYQTPETSWLSTYRNTKARTTIKETTGRIHSWGRNRSFIGVTSWSDDDDDDFISLQPVVVTECNAEVWTVTGHTFCLAKSNGFSSHFADIRPITQLLIGSSVVHSIDSLSALSLSCASTVHLCFIISFLTDLH